MKVHTRDWFGAGSKHLSSPLVGTCLRKEARTPQNPGGGVMVKRKQKTRFFIYKRIVFIYQKVRVLSLLCGSEEARIGAAGAAFFDLFKKGKKRILFTLQNHFCCFLRGRALARKPPETSPPLPRGQKHPRGLKFRGIPRNNSRESYFSTSTFQMVGSISFIT